MSPPARPPIVRSRDRHLTHRGVLWLGLRCDVRCTFCYDEHVPAPQKAWLGTGDAIAALEKFRFYYRNEFVDFMGGEPTLHPAILDIVAHAASIGLRPTVITHGMHLARPERAAAFAHAGVHDFLVSIHGLGDTAGAIHSRGKNNAARQMQALDNLRALGVPFRFNVTMIRDNLTQLEDIAALAADKGARVVNFLTFNPLLRVGTRHRDQFSGTPLRDRLLSQAGNRRLYRRRDRGQRPVLAALPATRLRAACLHWLPASL
jgi:MoaA/NifB/PqqE/SkfB family radical SAM enzyme